jgi:glucokinase
MTGRPQSFPRLLADIGGTNARFAWRSSPDASLEHIEILQCIEYSSIYEAIDSYLSNLGDRVPAACAIAIAGPVTGDEVAMTNHQWTFSASALKQYLGTSELLVLNDFTALALALPSVQEEHLRQVGGGHRKSGAAMALIGPGTGLGVSGLVPITGKNQYVPLPSQGGHVSVAPQSDDEFRAIERLRQRYGHVSIEDVASGRGLLALHGALCEVWGEPEPDPVTPAQLLSVAAAQWDGLARKAVDMFCGFLGAAAGDLALTLCARGGVFIGGGLVPRFGTLFDTSPFRRRFEEKGRFRPYLQEISTFVIVAPVSPALAGASAALDMAYY